MTTVEIEILRKGQAINQRLDDKTDYIASYGSNPAIDFTINCDQQKFDDNAKLLRYTIPINQQSRQLGIDFFQVLISGIVDKIYPAPAAQEPVNDFIHLRLITTPKEIAQLPFEMALTPVQLQKPVQSQKDPPRIPFFINNDIKNNIKVTFTRELRQSTFRNYNWPFKPRILFAWAQPNNTVPKQEQLNAFIKVLRPWSIPIKSSPEPVPDIAAMFTLLPDATLQSIKNAVSVAFNDKKPYTHIHLLAHGSKSDSANGEQFLLVLNSNNPAEKFYKADGAELAASLMVENSGQKFAPQVVSLIACDSGNTGSPVNPAGSIAHVLHQSGIPCVFASQFPLTQDGSVKLVTSLYTQLLQSSDPRRALYDTRMTLAETAGEDHDWASLVAYARFPENIDEQMKDIRLKIMLEFMKTANGLADHVIKYMNLIAPDKTKASFDEVNNRLDSSITNLTNLLNETQNEAINENRYAEHYGLIGSACKRKAEHVFRVSEYKKDVSAESKNASIQALKNAKDYYYKGYRYLNSHWNGTQYLSLAVWIETTPSANEKQKMWNFCEIKAGNDEQYADNDDEKKAWAYGTLAELYLLKPFIMKATIPDKDSFDIAKDYLQKLNGLQNQSFPKESTARQFERYINWFPNITDSDIVKQLQSMAAVLRKELPDLEKIS